MEELRRRITSSFLSSIAVHFTSILLNFGTKIILARILFPNDFGLFALGFLVVTIAGSFRNLGLDQSLIREKEEVFGNILLLEIFLGAGICLLLLWQNSLFSFLNPDLPSILAFFSILIITEGINITIVSIFKKTLELRKIAIVEISKGLSFAIMSICLACLGFRVWSLVIAQVVSSCLEAIFLSAKLFKEKKVIFTFKYSGYLLKKSQYFFWIGIIGLLLLDLDKGILGFFLSEDKVGYYVMAFSLVYLPTRIIEPPLRRIVYPLFCELKNDHLKLKKAYKDLTLAVLMVETPIYAVLMFNAYLIVKIIYGTRWLPIAPWVMMMALLPMVDPISMFGIDLLHALRKEKIQFLSSIPYLAIFIGLAIILTRFWGVKGMIIANYFQIGGIVISYFVLKFLKHSLDLFKKIGLIYLLPFILIGVATNISRGNYLASFIISLITMGACYLIFFYFFPSIVKEAQKSFFTFIRKSAQ